MDDFDLSQFRDLFIDEGQDYIQALNASLLALERDPGDADSLQDMFRAAHSLKGAAAAMGYDSLADLAHAMEDVLQKVRSGRWRIDSVLVDLLFSAIDALQSLLADVAADRVPAAGAESVLEQLRTYRPASDASVPTPEPFRRAVTEPGPEAEAQMSAQPDKGVLPPAQPVSELGETRMIRVDVRHLDVLLNIVTEMVMAARPDRGPGEPQPHADSVTGRSAGDADGALQSGIRPLPTHGARSAQGGEQRGAVDHRWGGCGDGPHGVGGAQRAPGASVAQCD